MSVCTSVAILREGCKPSPWHHGMAHSESIMFMYRIYVNRCWIVIAIAVAEEFCRKLWSIRTIAVEHTEQRWCRWQIHTHTHTLWYKAKAFFCKNIRVVPVANSPSRFLTVIAKVNAFVAYCLLANSSTFLLELFKIYYCTKSLITLLRLSFSNQFDIINLYSNIYERIRWYLLPWWLTHKIRLD